MPGRTLGRTTIACLAVFAAAWAASLAYLQASGASLAQPLISMAVGGLLLPGLVLALTRGTEAPAVPVERPRRELALVICYLVAYAAYFLGWAPGAVRAAAGTGLYRELAVLLLKLGVGVSAPAVLLYLLGAQIGPLFDPGLKRKGFWPILLVVGPAVAALVIFASGSPGIVHAEALPASVLVWAAPVAFLWVAATALTEEFVFRAVLQSRLQAVLGGALPAVAISALIYGLAHIPGIWLRGDAETLGYSRDLARVTAYVIAVFTPVGVLYGTIWARTRSLLLVILVHTFLSFTAKIAEAAALLTG
jgi:membrane protease YdiL (CAAX protease family)